MKLFKPFSEFYWSSFKICWAPSFFDHPQFSISDEQTLPYMATALFFFVGRSPIRCSLIGHTRVTGRSCHKNLRGLCFPSCAAAANSGGDTDGAMRHTRHAAGRRAFATGAPFLLAVTSERVVANGSASTGQFLAPFLRLPRWGPMLTNSRSCAAAVVLVNMSLLETNITLADR